jgi:hypothetical protein
LLILIIVRYRLIFSFYDSALSFVSSRSCTVNTPALKEEINTIIDLIYIAKDVVKKPIYLVYGHDEGALSIEVLNELKKRSDIDQTNPDYAYKQFMALAG